LKQVFSDRFDYLTAKTYEVNRHHAPDSWLRFGNMRVMRRDCGLWRCFSGGAVRTCYSDSAPRPEPLLAAMDCLSSPSEEVARATVDSGSFRPIDTIDTIPPQTLTLARFQAAQPGRIPAVETERTDSRHTGN
jgi:hypothetical protein